MRLPCVLVVAAIGCAYPVRPPQIAVAPLAVVSGSVTHPGDGSPVVGALVSVDDSAHSARTDASGRFTIAGLDRGTHWLYVEHDGFSPVYLPDVNIVSDTMRASLQMHPYPNPHLSARGDPTPLFITYHGQDSVWASIGEPRDTVDFSRVMSVSIYKGRLADGTVGGSRVERFGPSAFAGVVLIRLRASVVSPK